jgi:hypothetical protein
LAKAVVFWLLGRNGLQGEYLLALLRANGHAVSHAVALQVVQGVVVEGVEREGAAVIVLRE